ncbi:Rho GTPase activation protein [Gonapodya prolifera JEL478]|uniref:Rho GTPase activation protein n=1 Tax=Gonapodya prolifera (strain JEL478) TaxID=1344416 RepID=A0A139AUT6_GONPJ|nr:Rho GTPase activation protein [Gonapodya prolifera JEL478]|eukprot:KXS20343.1 Rho GTPase activation protein [Gonapodya prolifera JEL478]
MSGDSLSDAQLRSLAQERLLYAGGVDHESRPVLVFPLANIPALSSSDLDRLIPIMLDQTDSFVDSDYVIVLFAAGAQNAPGPMWFVRAYQQLERKYKKNLKKLIIVHATYWVKLLLQVFTPVASPKFASKVIWCDMIADLVPHLPTANLQIPVEVREVDARLLNAGTAAQRQPQSTPTTPARPNPPTSPPVFRASADAIPPSGIPHIVEDCLQVVERNLNVEGIFRRSPANADLQTAKAAYDRGERMTGGEGDESENGEATRFDVVVAGSLLKRYFRDMPTAVFHEPHVAALKEFQSLTSSSRTSFIHTKLIAPLPPTHRALLRRVFSTLRQVAANADTNKMTPRNLGVVWQPNLFRTADIAADMAVAGAAVEAVAIMIDSYDVVFAE